MRVRSFIALALLFLAIVVVPRGAAANDCSTFTGSSVTIGQDASCKNYIFGAHSNMQITAAAGTTVDGIYFTGACTGCTISITGTTVNNYIFSTPTASFSGGSIAIQGSTAKVIALPATFSGAVSVDIRHNTVTLDLSGIPAMPPAAIPQTAIPTFAVGIFSATAVMAVKDVTIVNNRVTVTANTQFPQFAPRHGLILAAMAEGSSATGQLLVYGNTVTCTGCTVAGLEVSFYRAVSTSNTAPYAVTGNVTVDYNKVVVTLTAVGDIFAACYVRSASFLTAKLRVEGNECVAKGSGRFNKVFGLRFAAPTTSTGGLAFFGFTFLACCECDAITVTKNTAVAGPLSGTLFAYGLYIAEFVAKTLVIDDNTAEANNPESVAYGGAYDPRCLNPASKFSNDWGGCPVVFFNCPVMSCLGGTCPLPVSSVSVQRNTFSATGGNGEVIGWWLQSLAMRAQQEVMGIKLGLPFKWEPYRFRTNTVTVLSKNSNRTRGVYYGVEELATMPSATLDSQFNVITVECTGTIPADPLVLTKNPDRVVASTCQGEVIIQGVPGAAIANQDNTVKGYLTSWPFLVNGKNFLGNTIRVTCGAGFRQCNGLHIQTEQYIKTYDQTWSDMDITIIEKGDQAPLYTGGYGFEMANDGMQRSAPIAFFRDKGDKTDRQPTKITITNLALRWVQRDIGDAAPQFRRSLFLIPANALSDPTITVSTSATFAVTRYLKHGWQPQTFAPTMILFPLAPAGKGSLSVVNVDASHYDYCEHQAPGSGLYEPCKWAVGPYARALSTVATDPASTIAATSTMKLVFAPAKLRGLMQRKCAGFFDPPLAIGCSNCQLQLGCTGCDDWWTGISAALTSNRWSRQFDTTSGWCPPPMTRERTATYNAPPPPPAPSRTQTITFPLTDTSELTLSRRLTHSRSLLPTGTPTISLWVKPPSYSDTYTLTQSPPLTDSVSQPETKSFTITRTRSPPPTKSTTPTQSRSPSPTVSIPACSPLMRLTATILGGVAHSARVVERQAVTIQLRLEPADKLSKHWDTFVDNVSRDHVEVLPVSRSGGSSGSGGDGTEMSLSSSSATPFEIISVRSRTSRVIDVVVAAPPGTNIFAEDVAGMISIDSSMLECRWRGRGGANGTGSSSSIVSAAAVFRRRFDFVESGASQAVLALGLLGMYFEAIFAGSSGISFWLAARRSIGFYDAVSCTMRKDTTMVVIDSPLQISIGSVGAPYLEVARGALIGNGVLVAVFALLCVGPSLYRSQRTWTPIFNVNAQSWAGAPAWMFPISAVLLPGSVQSIVELGAGKDGADILIVVLFGAVAVAAPLLVTYHIVLRMRPDHFWSFVQECFVAEVRMVDIEVKQKAVEEKKEDADKKPADESNKDRTELDMILDDDNDDDDGARSDRSRRSHRHRRSRNASRRGSINGDNNNNSSNRSKRGGGTDDERAEPKEGEDKGKDDEENAAKKSELGTRVMKEWVPVADPPLSHRLFVPRTTWKTRRQHFVNRYGTAFDRNGGRMYWITCAELLISVAGGIVAGWPGIKNDVHDAGCRSSIVAHCCLLMLGALLAVLCPFTVLFDNVAVLLIYALGVANAIVQVVGDYRGDNDMLFPSADKIVFSILVLCIAKAAIDILCFVFIRPSRTWAVNRVIAIATCRGRRRAARRAARLAASGDGMSGFIGPDGKEMTNRQKAQYDEQEARERERERELQRDFLPPPTALDPDDLTAERRRRQRLVEPLIEQLLPPPLVDSRKRRAGTDSAPAAGTHHHAFNFSPRQLSTTSRAPPVAASPPPPAVRDPRRSLPSDSILHLLPSRATSVASAAAAASASASPSPTSNNNNRASPPAALAHSNNVALSQLIEVESEDGRSWFNSNNNNNGGGGRPPSARGNAGARTNNNGNNLTPRSGRRASLRKL